MDAEFWVMAGKTAAYIVTGALSVYGAWCALPFKRKDRILKATGKAFKDGKITFGEILEVTGAALPQEGDETCEECPVRSDD